MTKFRLETTPSFERDFKHLDPPIRQRILDRLYWLADHPDQIGAPMKHLPADLKGLHKLRVGDHRALFWVNHNVRTITLYAVDHRRSVYGRFNR